MLPAKAGDTRENSEFKKTVYIKILQWLHESSDSIFIDTKAPETDELTYFDYVVQNKTAAYDTHDKHCEFIIKILFKNMQLKGELRTDVSFFLEKLITNNQQEACKLFNQYKLNLSTKIFDNSSYTVADALLHFASSSTLNKIFEIWKSRPQAKPVEVSFETTPALGVFNTSPKTSPKTSPTPKQIVLLLQAIKDGNAKKIDFILALNFDITRVTFTLWPRSTQEKKELSVLEYAAYCGNTDILKKFLALPSVEKDTIEIAIKNALNRGDIQTAQSILNTNFLKMPHTSISSYWANNSEMVYACLATVCDPKKKASSSDAITRSNFVSKIPANLFSNVLKTSVEKSNLDAVKILMESSSIEFRKNQQGAINHAATLAAESKQTKILGLLLAHGANLHPPLESEKAAAPKKIPKVIHSSSFFKERKQFDACLHKEREVNPSHSEVKIQAVMLQNVIIELLESYANQNWTWRNFRKEARAVAGDLRTITNPNMTIADLRKNFIASINAQSITTKEFNPNSTFLNLMNYILTIPEWRKTLEQSSEKEKELTFKLR
jgi:hypothetical protein